MIKRKCEHAHARSAPSPRSPGVQSGDSNYRDRAKSERSHHRKLRPSFAHCQHHSSRLRKTQTIATAPTALAMSISCIVHHTKLPRNDTSSSVGSRRMNSPNVSSTAAMTCGTDSLRSTLIQIKSPAHRSGREPANNPGENHQIANPLFARGSDYRQDSNHRVNTSPQKHPITNVPAEAPHRVSSSQARGSDFVKLRDRLTVQSPIRPNVVDVHPDPPLRL